MAPVIAYHLTLATYGFWLPNDPRGSGSTEVRAENLRPFGPATFTDSRRSVARRPHDRSLRKSAKQALKYPEVYFTGHQALSVMKGFATQVGKSRYRIHACSIMPQHVHLVAMRHHYPVEQVGRLLRQAGTSQLLEDGLHPFANLRSSNGRLPSVWGQDFHKDFIFNEKQLLHWIKYVEENPVKEGKKPQQWPFVIPYTGELG